MPIVDPWSHIDEDARLIAIAATLRTLKDHGTLDNDVIREHVGNLAQNDLALIGPSMHIAQWISGSSKLPW
ncbi:MAG: hypothetical protein M3Q19_14565 [Pseudomonadota bacterium]|nr:hypothetical protein [Pseudomonadota bacterium]